MNDIEWRDPPPSRRPGDGGTKPSLVEKIERLKEHPGEWAYFGDYAQAAGGRDIEKRYPGTDATSRKREDGRFDIYVRWVGT